MYKEYKRCMDTYRLIHAYIYKFVCIYIRIYPYISVYIYTYTYTQIHTQKHTHTHTHTHTDTPPKHTYTYIQKKKIIQSTRLQYRVYIKMILSYHILTLVITIQWSFIFFKYTHTIMNVD